MTLTRQPNKIKLYAISYFRILNLNFCQHKFEVTYQSIKLHNTGSLNYFTHYDDF